MEKVKRLSVRLLPHRLAVAQTVLLLVCSFVIFTSQASAVIRFTNRSLLINSSEPGATATYQVSFTYTTQTNIGSVDMQFCYDPIPYDPCDAPVGLDVSHAALSDQAGNIGYSIATQSTNHLVLTRTPQPVDSSPSTYTFTGIVNPADTSQSFSIRLSDYSSTDASGPIVDLGSIVSESTPAVKLETQVPPMLIFCLGQEVDLGCGSTNGVNYTDLGALSPTSTLTATSQMAAGTNASQGYVITANGTTMAAGTNVIDAPANPTVSAPGSNQFGLNLVANAVPAIGVDPDGESTNAAAAPNYNTPNKYMYKSGDVVASAPNVSLMRRYTVSYIVNASPSLRAGVYTTTITYICTGRF